MAVQPDNANYFRLPYQLKGELTAVYNSRSLAGINEIAKSSGGIDIGLQRLFLTTALQLLLALLIFFTPNAGIVRAICLT